MSLRADAPEPRLHKPLFAMNIVPAFRHHHNATALPRLHLESPSNGQAHRTGTRGPDQPIATLPQLRSAARSGICARFPATFAVIAFTAFLPLKSQSAEQPPRPDFVFITIDDMNCDSVGVYGCPVPETTPAMDRLAAEGLRFTQAHVVAANCFPSRNAMLSGSFPHSNGAEGFYAVQPPRRAVLPAVLKSEGYFTAVKGKASHMTPYHPFEWDAELTPAEIGQDRHNQTRNPRGYYLATREAIALSRASDKPLFLNINVNDPHEPFYGVSKKGQPRNDPLKPSRIYTADDVVVPGFLPDTPEVRRELGHYYSSVRRADDCVAETLRALDESGLRENTVVMLVADQGMPFPWAKTNVYRHSSRTPWIVRWPGVVKPGAVDSAHMVSTVDFMPTVLEIAGIAAPGPMDGRSILPLLKGDAQDGRGFVFKEHNENSSGTRNPMRSVETPRFGYIYNAWADGVRTFRTATAGTLAFDAMKERGRTDPVAAARLTFFEKRVPEEFYDYEKDPDALHNLIADPRYAEEIVRLKDALEAWMVRTDDDLLEAFRAGPGSPAERHYMDRVERESAARRKAGRLKAWKTEE